jgi:hypothetical protein
MAKISSEMFTVVWEGEAKTFTNKEEAKAFYTENKKEYPETILLKTIITTEELEYNGNGVWL